MLSRTVKRLGTLPSVSRQSLPRPARLYYSTPSKRTDSPALATKHADHNLTNPDMEGFLATPPKFTFLPSLLPESSSSSNRPLWFADSFTQDQMAIINACLHNFFDVPRARSIFDRLRSERGSVTYLEPRMYNAFLEAYIGMASNESEPNKEYWLESAWELYDVIESEMERVAPSEETYATMLLAWHRFGPDSPNHIPDVGAQPPKTLLKAINERQISLEAIVANRVFTSSEEVAAIIRVLSKAAVDLNLSHIVSQLGQAEIVGTHAPDILDDVPEARPVLKEKKREPGSDSKTSLEEEDPEYEVPFNLANLRRHLADISFARRVLPSDVVSRQKLLEETVYDTAVERLRHESSVFEELGLDNGSLRQPDLRRWMWEWHSKLQARLTAEVKSISEAERKKTFRAHGHNRNALLSPYLSLVNPERLSLITILEIMRLQGSGGVAEGMKTTRALISVGKAVESEYKAQMCRRNNISLPAVAKPGESGYFSNMGYKNLRERRLVAARHMQEGEAWSTAWTQATRAKVGGILVECLMDVATVERSMVFKGETVSETQQAFHHCYIHNRGQKLGVIRLNPAVSERLSKDSLGDTLHPRHLPMLVKPKPWLTYNEGGYFFNQVPAMRYKDSIEQQSYLKHASELGNVELVYAGLDVLGSTPWKINRAVFDVVLKVWNSGERLGKVPPANLDDAEPQPPTDGNPRSRVVYLAQMKQWTQDKASNHSDRCSVNYKIEIARTFLGDTIYFPHNIDFRGRAYPVPPHLNHIGDDLSRGLLMFAEGKPLGARGLRWLKIHLANLYGYDKANFDERVQFVEERLEHVFDSAMNPLEGGRWWTHADDPWQCLSTCKELHAALTSENPEEYVSCLPVHQDGTCNGLQHYAALGGDSRGAEQVNLAAGERPSDVYTYVGNMAEKVLKEDAERGEKYAVMLAGKITRKLVKQTVMTTVYGVTFIGAREQIEKQMRLAKHVPPEEFFMASAYLAKVVLNCIGDLFTGAKSIQNWLNMSARLVAKSIPGERIPEALEELRKKSKNNKATVTVDLLKREQMTSVVWTTPLGLPIVQPYRKPKRKQIMTKMQTVFISDPNSPAEVNMSKQASAFPPNFIHSLDATHMMLTALECQTRGMTFAAVHDSYWTHASNIDEMSTIIRDTFIALHSSEVLTKLHSEFKERYKGYKVPLTQLQGGGLVKTLRDMGVRFKATPEQARMLEPLSSLIEISEDDSSIEESQDTEDLKEIFRTEQEEKSTQPPKKKEQDEDEEFDDEDDSHEHEHEHVVEDDPQESSRAKAARLRKEQDAKAAIEMFGKFVNVTDLFPPLPKKGDFKVEAIKASQYFFS
ncbi:DNA-directed RNA polymerase [Marasmius tenuissimus]|uniref:DNA-directed RNA polymerase n=1 Tax=Marasmius tenuissimus TaxID=585030 RepID=A0ABR2ZIS9_9AGAR